MSNIKIAIYLIVFCLFSCERGNQEYHYNDKGLLIKQYFYPNGTLKKKCSYKDNNLHGTCKEYNNNGILIEEVHYHNGKPHGPAKSYHSNGITSAVVNYKMGSLEGECSYYYKNGNIKQKGYFSNNLPNGVYKFYDTLEVIEKEISFHNGKQEGKAIEYNKIDGGIKYFDYYRADTLVYSRYYEDQESISNNTYPILDVILPKKIINQGDSIYLEVVPVPDIPQVKLDIALGNLIDPENEQFDSPTYPKKQGGKLIFKRLYNKKGNYQMGLVIFFKDAETDEKIGLSLYIHDSLKIKVL